MRTLEISVAASKHAIEFRDPSWYDDRVFALLERHRVALCLHDMAGVSTYDDERLDAWSRWLSDQAAAGRDVYAYFNNDTGGHAPRDAVRLRGRIYRAWRREEVDVQSLPACRTGPWD